MPWRWSTRPWRGRDDGGEQWYFAELLAHQGRAAAPWGRTIGPWRRRRRASHGRSMSPGEQGALFLGVARRPQPRAALPHPTGPRGGKRDGSWRRSYARFSEGLEDRGPPRRGGRCFRFMPSGREPSSPGRAPPRSPGGWNQRITPGVEREADGDHDDVVAPAWGVPREAGPAAALHGDAGSDAPRRGKPRTAGSKPRSAPQPGDGRRPRSSPP